VPNFVFVLIGIAVLAAIFFFLRSKKTESAEVEELEAEKPQKLPAKSAPSVRPQPEKPAAAPKEAAREQPRTEKAEKAEKPEKAQKPAKQEPEQAAAKPAPEPKGDFSEPTKTETKRTEASRVSAKPAAPKRAKDVAGLRRGLARARETEGFFGRLKALFTGRKEIDPNIAEQMEEILLSSDVGVATTQELVDAVKGKLSRGELTDEAKVWDALRGKATELLDNGGGALVFETKPTVVMVVGVNGVGKTTTIGKLATRLTREGSKVVLAAGDTFRAAAVNQLLVWGKRAGCEVVTGAEGANAGAVIFDAIQKAKEIGADVVLADTAGRLHTKTNLMDELKKIARTMTKAMDGAPHETLLVLDSTNGQNAIQQAALFKEALPLTGIVLTKLDGTAKGGVILGISAEHKVPVRYIGVGEKAEDLRDFDAAEFVEALLGSSAESSERAA
jgi:fused signal recognition particle receptor